MSGERVVWRALYRNGKFVGAVDTSGLAEEIVSALNGVERCAERDAAPAPVDIEAEAEKLFAFAHGPLLRVSWPNLQESTRDSWRAVAQYVAEREGKLRAEWVKELNETHLFAEQMVEERDSLRTQLAESEAEREKAKDAFQYAAKERDEMRGHYEAERAKITALETERDEHKERADGNYDSYERILNLSSQTARELAALRGPLSDAQVEAGTNAIKAIGGWTRLDEPPIRVVELLLAAVRGVPSEPAKQRPLYRCPLCGLEGMTGRCETCCATAKPAEPAAWTEALDKMREAGWLVAVHNDYVQNGRVFTFWGFSKEGRFVKGEGSCDRDAIEAAWLAAGREGGK